MRKILIHCDRCGVKIKLETGSEVQLSGTWIGFYREQTGSIMPHEQYEVCSSCASEIRAFINNR